MKKTLLITAASWAMLAATAGAEPAAYLSTGMGVANLKDTSLSDELGYLADVSFDSGHALAFALGKVFDPFRLELELAYRKNDIDSLGVFGLVLPAGGSVTAKSALVNLYRDFQTWQSWQPFLGVGAGLAMVELDNFTVLGVRFTDEDDTVFAWQALAGISVPLADRMRLDISYRYFATADPNFDGVKAEYASHNFMAGLRYSF